MSSIQFIPSNHARPRTEYRSTDSAYINTCLHDQVAEDRGLTSEQPLTLARAVGATEQLNGISFHTWPVDSLIDYIVNAYHRPAKENAVIIYELAQKVAYLRSEAYPDLRKLTTALFLFVHDLLHHLKVKERILFPHIRQLVKIKQGAAINPNSFELMRIAAESVRSEYTAVSAWLENLGDLTDNFIPPVDACHEHQDLIARMKRFQNELSLHIKLENEVLFPQALLLENEVKNR